jgi:phosphate transport system permease protein
MAVAAEPPPPAPSRKAAPSVLSEVLFQALTTSAGLFILTLVAGLVGVLVWQAWPVLSRAGHYELFTSAEWVPKPPGGGAPTFGSLAFIWGTVATSVLAMLIAVPLGVASAAFLSEIAPGWVRRVGAFLVELLAAIPSVVYGFWGLFFLAPVVQDAITALGGPNTGGNGILSAGLILSIMVLPYITAISFDVCQAVPRSQREGSLALGATRWQTIRNVVLPYARPGIVAACFLALGRALGETMAVTMLIGNKAVIDPSPFAYGDSIASKIANSLN